MTHNGYDCPISRDRVFAAAEERGLGSKKYYVLGYDAVTNAPMVSFQGHLGYTKEGQFYDVHTKSVYFDAFCFPWGLQKTCLSYMDSIDRITGSSHKKEFLSFFDEDDDGIVTFEEFGKMGGHAILLHLAGNYLTNSALEELGHLKGRFILYSNVLKNMNTKWNASGNAFLSERRFNSICLTAFQMSMMVEMPDPFIPEMTWGNGKWPSFPMAELAYLGTILFGRSFPFKIDPVSMYGQALFYADLTQNGGEYAGRIITQPNPDAVMKYIRVVSESGTKTLDFTFFVPQGFDNPLGRKIPNVEVAKDPAEIFTAKFSGGKETWPAQE